LSEDVAERVAKTLKVLANPIRLRILALCLRREYTSRELREILGISKPLLIAHLRKLVDAGFLEYRVELDRGKMIVRKYYRTKSDIRVCVDKALLEKVAENLEGV